MDAAVATFLIFGAVAVVFGVGSLYANQVLGARSRRSYLQATTYECGEEAQGEAQIDFPTQHYTFAIIFVAVDVIGFILALWALNFRSAVVVSSEWGPTAIAVGFTALALVGIYYALQGEKRWVI